MKTIDVGQNLVEVYSQLLANLSKDNKLELITRLSQSMKGDKTTSKTPDSLFGSFQSEKSAEQIIEEIREARLFNRQIEQF